MPATLAPRDNTATIGGQTGMPAPVRIRELPVYVQSGIELNKSIAFDEHGVWRAIKGRRPPAGVGLLVDFAPRVVTDWLAHFPSVVIRRSAYETVGGYCAFFECCCDWDMWMRVGLNGSVACVPRPYALYRQHLESQTTRHIASGLTPRSCGLLAD